MQWLPWLLVAIVSHSHLSAGNSESSPSRDRFAEFGVSNPSSPTMLESEPVPLDFSIDSDESAANSDWDNKMGLGQHSPLGDIFKAAQHFSRQDRIDVVEERLKNQKLVHFLNAHGFSIKEVHDFSESGVLHKRVHAHDLFDKSPMRDGCISNAVEAAPAPPMPSASLCPGLEEGEIPSNFGPTALNTKSSWSSIVAADVPRKPILKFFPPSVKDGIISIRPPPEVLNKGRELWSNSLVGYFLHSKLPFKVVEPVV